VAGVHFPEKKVEFNLDGVTARKWKPENILVNHQPLNASDPVLLNREQGESFARSKIEFLLKDADFDWNQVNGASLDLRLDYPFEQRWPGGFADAIPQSMEGSTQVSREGDSIKISTIIARPFYEGGIPPNHRVYKPHRVSLLTDSWDGFDEWLIDWQPEIQIKP
jgi:hypothetical protein